jgi:site-specific recombinase XerD
VRNITAQWIGSLSDMLHFRNNSLPEPIEKYLKEFSSTHASNTTNMQRASLSHFHRFLTQAKLFDLNLLTREHILKFDEDLRQHNLALATRSNYIKMVHAYLRWLSDAAIISADVSKKLFPEWKIENIKARTSTLPELATRFLEVLSSNSSRSTVCGYRSALRGFYSLHWKTKKLAYHIDRTDIDSYMIYLPTRHKSLNQRGGRLLQLRRYLDWLHDHKKLKIHPDLLITSRDLPRREEGLPKPFPVAVDLEIQRRLEEADNIDSLGLLIMRRCGLRVGELCMLTLDCVQNDLNGNFFLKVPLGKLKNERVIPLDPKTVEIIERVQRYHAHHAIDSKRGSVHLISHPSGRQRKPQHFKMVLDDVVRGLAIPGRPNLHRLRHSFATSMLSAGLSITTLKTLLGHRDIKMTLNYAAVTQETVRNEYFTALTKVQTRYEATQYPLKTPDLADGINRALKDIPRLMKKYIEMHGDPNPEKIRRMLFRVNDLRQEFSVILVKKIDSSL